MAINAIVIENLIKEAFPDAEVKVDGADGVHMSAIVASSQFCLLYTSELPTIYSV